MLSYYWVIVEPLKSGKFYTSDFKNIEYFDTLEEAERFYERVLFNYKRGLYATRPYIINLKDCDYEITSNHDVVEYRWAKHNGEKVVEARYVGYGYPWNEKNPWLFRVSEEKKEYWKWMRKFKVYRSNISIG